MALLMDVQKPIIYRVRPPAVQGMIRVIMRFRLRHNLLGTSFCEGSVMEEWRQCDGLSLPLQRHPTRERDQFGADALLFQNVFCTG